MIKKYVSFFYIVLIISTDTIIGAVPLPLKRNVVLGFMGDVMIGRTVNEKIDQTSYSYPWGNVQSLLYKNDFNIINLETTLTTSTAKIPKVFNFKATPDKVQTLTEGNITLATVANNHILDFFLEGMYETLTTLDNSGIKHVGAGKNEAEARKPAILEGKGIKIGILGCTDNEPTWAAEPDKPGTNYIKVGDTTRIKKDIQKLKKRVDIVIVSIHWGPNFREKPNPYFVDFAHTLIDSGADIIHGHSAHILQGIEIYKDKLIMYDTGDFIDDYAVNPLLRNDYSALFLVCVSKEGVHRLQLIPVIIKDMQVNKAYGKEYQAIIDRIRKLSQEFGTKVSTTGEIFIKKQSYSFF